MKGGAEGVSALGRLLLALHFGYVRRWDAGAQLRQGCAPARCMGVA
jgi:hypothetical protein